LGVDNYFGFEVVARDREYVFGVKVKEERDRWVQHINEII
jgi:hypothetical protein